MGNLGATGIEETAEAVNFAIKQGTARAELEQLCKGLTLELSVLIEALQNVLQEVGRAT